MTQSIASEQRAGKSGASPASSSRTSSVDGSRKARPINSSPTVIASFTVSGLSRSRMIRSELNGESCLWSPIINRRCDSNRGDNSSPPVAFPASSTMAQSNWPRSSISRSSSNEFVVAKTTLAARTIRPSNACLAYFGWTLSPTANCVETPASCSAICRSFGGASATSWLFASRAKTSWDCLRIS